MSTHTLRKSGGWAALIAGCLQILGLIFLILFFAIELPQGDASNLRFGYLSDVTPIIFAPVFLVVVVMLFLLQRKDSPALSAIAAILGSIGTLMTAWTNIRFVSGAISLEKQIQLFYLAMAFFGSWHLLINLLARRKGSLPSRLTTFGILVGVGQLIMYVGSVILGGFEDMDFDRILQDIPLLVSLIIAIPMVLIGYLGAPFWLVSLGRALLREHTGVSSPDESDSLET